MKINVFSLHSPCNDIFKVLCKYAFMLLAGCAQGHSEIPVGNASIMSDCPGDHLEKYQKSHP